jgi:RNA-directed DNA polymerase
MFIIAKILYDHPATGNLGGGRVFFASYLTRGWVGYFRLASVKAAFEQLDQWLRRRLRKILWEQWRKPNTRRRKLIALGVEATRARKAAATGLGAWWNAGASHMHAAVTIRLLAQWGLLGLLNQLRGWQRST